MFVVIDCLLTHSRYPGHLNDSWTYWVLPRIGFNHQRALPQAARLLADGGYAARVQLITSRGIARNHRIRHKNRELRHLRVRIEHSIVALKIYRSISMIFKQKRPFLPIVVATCGFWPTEDKDFYNNLKLSDLDTVWFKQVIGEIYGLQEKAV